MRSEKMVRKTYPWRRCEPGYHCRERTFEINQSAVKCKYVIWLSTNFLSSWFVQVVDPRNTVIGVRKCKDVHPSKIFVSRRCKAEQVVTSGKTYNQACWLLTRPPVEHIFEVKVKTYRLVKGSGTTKHHPDPTPNEGCAERCMLTGGYATPSYTANNVDAKWFAENRSIPSSG